MLRIDLIRSRRLRVPGYRAVRGRSRRSINHAIRIGSRGRGEGGSWVTSESGSAERRRRRQWQMLEARAARGGTTVPE